MSKSVVISVRVMSIICFALILVSCKTKYSTARLDTYFTPREIQDLKKIREFFRSEMCYGLDADFKTCFENTPHEYLELSGNAFWTIIDYEKQKKLYQEISKSTFDAIWKKYPITYFPSEESGVHLAANVKGRYLDFLKSLGADNTEVAKYANQVEQTGGYDLVGLWYSYILNDTKSYNLGDPNIQLMLAIHYLTLNDDNMRNREMMKNPRPILKSWKRIE